MTDNDSVNLLAKAIMGWSRGDIITHTIYHSSLQLKWGNSPDSPPWFVQSGENWDPFTNISDAWMLLEKVAGRKHWRYELVSSDGLDAGPLYWVTIYHGKAIAGQGESKFGDNEDSVQRAICNAVLSYLGLSAKNETTTN